MVCTADQDSAIVTVATASSGTLRCDAPSSNTIAPMLANAPSAVTSKIRKTAIVLQHRVTADMAVIAAKHHDVGEHEIDSKRRYPS